MKVVGINSGLGVAVYAFKKHLVANVETRSVFHTKDNDQWKANFENIPLHKSFNTLRKIKDVDAIISTPDCGAASIFRLSRAKEYGTHKTNKSLDEFFKGLEFFKPKFFLFENLEGLFKTVTEDDFKEACPQYKLVIYNHPVTVFGNSQVNRKRLVIVGIRKDLPKGLKKYFKLDDIPEEGYDLKKCKKLMQGLGFKEDERFGHVREDMNKPIAIHGGKSMTPKQIRKEWKTRLKGKGRFYTDPKDNLKFKTAPGVYRNLSKSYPATARRANRQFDHHGLMMTPRQLARIMGVPDEFKIYIGNSNKLYWINKARTTITKGMVYEVSLWFKKGLKKALARTK